MTATQRRPAEAHVPDCGNHQWGAMRLLPMAQVKQLSELSRWRAALQIAVEYASIAGAAWLCERFFNPLLYCVVMAFIGARILGLGVLMHDAAHYRLFPSRKLNDLAGSFLVAPALFVSMQDYRRLHLTHHRTLGTDGDPELPFRAMFATRQKLAVLVIGSLIGISGVMFVVGINRGRSRVVAALALAAFAALFVLAPGTARLVALYWVLPFMIWTASANVLRTFAEHLDVSPEASFEDRVYSARSIVLSWLERLFIAPNHVGYHLDHHLYPSVPFYRLPLLHRALQANTQYRVLTREYHGFADVIADHAARSRSAPPAPHTEGVKLA